MVIHLLHKANNLFWTIQQLNRVTDPEPMVLLKHYVTTIAIMTINPSNGGKKNIQRLLGI